VLPSFFPTSIKLIWCNTLGVCHQLCNGFELKLGKLGGDEDVKAKPMEMIPNLKFDNAPLLTYRPFPNVCFSKANGTYFMYSHHSLSIVITGKVL
jgi:hypothetical protein